MNVKLLLLFCLAAFDTRTDAEPLNLQPVNTLADNLVNTIDEIIRKKFDIFKKTFKKTYATREEEEERLTKFAYNSRYVDSHNLKYMQNETTFQVEINHLADQSLAEHIQQMNGFNQTAQQWMSDQPDNDMMSKLRIARATGQSVPALVDWRTKGAVNPIIPNQGKCGSCWTFATVGAIEAQYFRMTGNLTSLSQQQLLDCSRNNGNNGCKGGTTRRAMEYVNSVGGLMTSAEYPYVTAQQSCTFRKENVVPMKVAYHQMKYGSEVEMVRTLASQGPFCIAVDAAHKSWQLYKSGVYSEPACRPGITNHAVVVVGYGTDKPTGLKYWLVRNSYGPKWGEGGYIKMARYLNNNCCVACWPVIPLIRN